LVDLAGPLHANPGGMLETVAWLSRVVSSGGWAQLVDEHAELRAELAVRHQARELQLPANWAVEEGTSLLLYALVRELMPSVVVEVGVGNGHSSVVILRALGRNQRGALHSFDIDPRAGDLVDEEERERWALSLVSRKRSARDLRQLLERVPRAQVCFHDAGHAYLPQYFEFTTLWEKLTDDGVLVCDDVDTSRALIDFCARTGARPEILMDARKAVALVPRPELL
jgi:predicted O-methyltransferase YrrM